ncbi:MAG: peptidase M42, partial [Clostridia bacterium]|nr:peptidase M42 [Clostridia bacterium]
MNSYVFDEKYCLDIFERLIGIDSTTGQYEEIEAEAEKLITGMGFPVIKTRKGGIIADLGGDGEPLAVTAHLD